ncbi:unnamed protein product [Leptidea sinapis]|uniref:Uncharacterized protein n=1 Tax=Leptidea sinapis TaxID=189913 RepID=A0A5E4QSZ3_9NEOP|nr:unnamed protein product [Leptidea sinapis]
MQASKPKSYVRSTYVYTKLRKSFGRQPLFQDVPAHLLDSISPDRAEQNLYCLRNPVHEFVQATLPQALHETNTNVVELREQGVNHTEGGWPRDVHLLNEEHVARHRRRVRHEDGYVRAVLGLTPQVTRCIDQNNAIDMYQTYFDNIPPQAPVEKYNLQVANVFRDQFKRPVSCITWTNEKKSRLAVSYSEQVYFSVTHSTAPTACYLWDVNIQSAPLLEFKPESSCWRLACSPSDPDVLLAGLDKGITGLFDFRVSSQAVASTSIYNSHDAPVSGLLYLHTRTNREFFSSSPDGQCLWWDARNLSKPFDQLCMAVRLGPNEEPSLSKAEGISSLEYDRGLPTKFLSGTESGLVINANRMGRSHSEILASYWRAHDGPVRAVHRSPCTLRMFITCGDWSVRIWSEEVRTAPIIVTKPYRHEVTDVAWAPLRYSSYMAVCDGGVFYYWDLLRKQREPVASLQVTKQGLTKVTPHPDGELIATGDNDGSLFLLHVSDNMAVPGSHDKQLVNQIYNQQSKREHILDNRVKEIRLKLRENAALEGEGLAEECGDVEEILEKTEEDYFAIVQDELNKME